MFKAPDERNYRSCRRDAPQMFGTLMSSRQAEFELTNMTVLKGGMPRRKAAVHFAARKDPRARQSKSGESDTTALIKAGTQAEPISANVISFSEAAQGELLALREGDAVSVQGAGHIAVFVDKGGEHRPSVASSAGSLAWRVDDLAGRFGS